MGDDSRFLDLIHRVRSGDGEAATELVLRFEPQIRRVIRIRLADSNLRRVLDSMDVCNSVLGEFFVRAAAGQFELESPEKLINLLAQMARNRIINHAKKQQAMRRDIRRTVATDVAELGLPANTETPSRIVSSQELLDLVFDRFTEEEREIVDYRTVERMSWQEIAERLGSNEDAVRKRFTRALDRVAEMLSLDEVSLG